MGFVYLARDARLDRTVALKTIHEDAPDRREALARFRNEARAASALNHPAIVHIYDIDEVTPVLPGNVPSPFGPVLYTAMEHVRGETLRARIRSGPVDPDKLLDWFTQLCEGIAKAHESGILHRDLKPENVMITPDGHVKILDFGLAKRAPNPDFDFDTPTESLMTGDGIGYGTASYMAPEQLCGRPASAASDLFAIGCMLYEALAGKHPFSRSSVVETVHAIVYERPSPLPASPVISPLLSQIVVRCLEKDPEARCRSARQLALDLREVRSRSDSKSSGPAPQSRVVAPTDRSLTRRFLLPALLATAVLLVAAIFAWRASRDHRAVVVPRAPSITRIAILPFENKGGGADSEYLSDGMTEALIYDLSRSRTLRVIPRSSVFQFKGKSVAPGTAARALGVDAVVVGEVSQHLDNLVVSAEMIDGDGGALLWGTRIEKPQTGLVEIKEEIASGIRESLHLESVPRRTSTGDAEAFRLYLRGRYFWNKRTADGLQRAIGQFQSAIDQDPSYALAWVGLGDSYALLEQYAGIPSRENCPKAEEAIRRAQQLEPSLAPAWASMGLLSAHCAWNWTQSEQSFQRAIELDPHYATTRHWYSLHLAYRSRFDDARREAKRAQEIDPLSLIAGNAQSVVEGYAGNWNAVVAQSDRLLEMDERFAVAHMWKGRALRAEGKLGDATRELERGLELTEGRSPELIGELGSTYALAGRRADAERLAKDLAGNKSAAYPLAAIHASLGRHDEAIAQLQRAIEDHSWFLVQLKVEPLFAPLREDPRFKEMLAKVKLP